jgi:hypothetical protein
MASSAPSPQITKHDLETRLIEKCWKEPGFRKQVLADPKGAFERQLGRPLPADLKIVIHEDSANTINLALPPIPTNAAELSDEDLEKVAGGTEVAVLTIIATIGAVVATGAGLAAASAYGTAAAQGKSSPW